MIGYGETRITHGFTIYVYNVITVTGYNKHDRKISAVNAQDACVYEKYATAFCLVHLHGPIFCEF